MSRINLLVQIFINTRDSWFFWSVRGKFFVGVVMATRVHCKFFVGVVTASVYGSTHMGFLVSECVDT